MRYRSRYPSVPHQAIVAWFGPDESKRYYARRSRRRWVLSNGTFTHRGYKHELTRRIREIGRWEAEGTLFEHTLPLSEILEMAGITQEEPPPPPRPVAINADVDEEVKP